MDEVEIQKNNPSDKTQIPQDQTIKKQQRKVTLMESGSSSSSKKGRIIQGLQHPSDNGPHLISRSLTSKTRVLLAGMPGRPLLPYAALGGTVRRRSPPMAMPRMPTSQPLMTSPLPILKLNGLPFLLAAGDVLASGSRYSKRPWKGGRKTHHRTASRSGACQCTASQRYPRS